MKKIYKKPELAILKTTNDTPIMGMSVYEQGNNTPVDKAGNGGTPVTDGDGYAWNSAKDWPQYSAWED